MRDRILLERLRFTPLEIRLLWNGGNLDVTSGLISNGVNVIRETRVIEYAR